MRNFIFWFLTVKKKQDFAGEFLCLFLRNKSGNKNNPLGLKMTKNTKGIVYERLPNEAQDTNTKNKRLTRHIGAGPKTQTLIQSRENPLKLPYRPGHKNHRGIRTTH